MRDRLAPAKILKLALRMLARDWRAGELTVLAAALVLAVGSMGTVGFFADRVKSALTSQASLLLGGDVMISSDRPLPEITVPFWNWLFDQDPGAVGGERFAAQHEDARWLQHA